MTDFGSEKCRCNRCGDEFTFSHNYYSKIDSFTDSNVHGTSLCSSCQSKADEIEAKQKKEREDLDDEYKPNA